MSDYQDLVKKEAKAYFDANWKLYEADAGELGGKSAAPNFSRWMDKQETLSARIQEIAAKWGLKELHWVQSNTRSKQPRGGDPRSSAFASLLQDVRHEVKKLVKG